MSKGDFSIGPEGFVQEFKDLKDYLVSNYFSSSSDISRIGKLKKAGLSVDQINLTKVIVDETLTDVLYTVLLGLEGSASICKHDNLLCHPRFPPPDFPKSTQVFRYFLILH